MMASKGKELTMRRGRISRIAKVLVLAMIALAPVATSAVSSAEEMKKPPEFQVNTMSKYGFDGTVETLKGAIERQNMMVINEIDPQKMLRMVGVRTKGMRQIQFFHPRFMKQIIETNAHASIEAPLKVAVMEGPDGTVMVKFIKPTSLFGRYGGLDDLGKELEGVVTKIVDAVKK